MKNKNNTSGRGIIKFGEYVYITTENRVNGAELWRCKSETIKNQLESTKVDDENINKSWTRIISNGLGNDKNFWFSDLIVFENQLYMGTMDNVHGFSIFRSDDGFNFDRIANKGINSVFNHAAMLMYVFNEKLYISSMNWVQGFCVFEMQNHSKNPTFEPVLENGFDNPFNAYIWQMCEFNGRLYIGSFQNSFLGLRLGMFSLYSSEDGRNWTIETDNAFASKSSPWYAFFFVFLEIFYLHLFLLGF